MRKRKAQKAAPKIQKLMTQLNRFQSEVQGALRDRTLFKDLRLARGKLERQARKRLKEEGERLKAFLSLAQDELETIQKQYTPEKVKTLLRRKKKRRA